jgi:hypothetical protein
MKRIVAWGWVVGQHRDDSRVCFTGWRVSTSAPQRMRSLCLHPPSAPHRGRSCTTKGWIIYDPPPRQFRRCMSPRPPSPFSADQHVVVTIRCARYPCDSAEPDSQVVRGLLASLLRWRRMIASSARLVLASAVEQLPTCSAHTPYSINSVVQLMAWMRESRSRCARARSSS